MSALVTTLLAYVLLYRYIAIFVIVFSAGVIVPFPASAMLMGIGAFISHGYFSFSAVATTAIAANVLGDIAAFLAVRRYGNRVVRLLHVQTGMFATLEKYIRSDAGPTVFITRFAGSLGPVTNIMAGLADVRFVPTFLIPDIAGNAAEILILLVFGYFVGDYWENFSGIQSTIVGIIIIGVIAFFLYKLYGSLRRRYTNH
ncbi:MAG TPA: VTT domain-containing protein [Candidatus Paceibacterota bacterium]|nr:VTT domain-containing protein [Candidatus Paceibacterota bacterium]